MQPPVTTAIAQPLPISAAGTSWPSVEVVVCTRNRARLLERACEAILLQDYPPELWRLLIVDNLSTDDTPALAESIARRFPGRVRALRNREVGHSAARNAAVKETAATVVAFTDDDALPDPSWLRTLVETMAREGAQAGGGPVDIVLSGELPPWFLEDYLPYLAIWRPYEQVTRLVYNEHPRGVNLAVLRGAFEEHGAFSPHLGLRGRRRLYCEETEMCLRIERGGGRVVYSPLSRVRHCVEASRLTARWLSHRFLAQGRSEAIVNWMHGGPRGLALGSRVHLANLRSVNPNSLRSRLLGAIAPADDAELLRAARLLTHCRRRALLGYWLEAPRAMATVPRYRPCAASGLGGWQPPAPPGES